MNLFADPSEGAAGLTLADWLGVAATVVAVFGIILAIILFMRAKATKSLDYRIIASQSLTTNEAYPDLQIRAVYDANSRKRISLEGRKQAIAADDNYGWTVEAKRESDEIQRKMGDLEPVLLTSPSIHTVEIRNTGKLEINDDMFKDPIQIWVPRARIVDASVVEKSAGGIYPYGSISGDGPTEYLTFRPRLMNARDWLRIRMLTDGSDELPVLECWIVGQTRPMRGDPPVSVATGRRMAEIALFIWIALLAFPSVSSIFNSGPEYTILPIIIATLVTLLCAGFPVLLFDHYSERARNWRGTSATGADYPVAARRR